MFPFFHVFVPLAFVEIYNWHCSIAKKPKISYHRAALIIGSMLPDIIDKPLELIWGLSGRGAGHSLIVLSIILLSVGFVHAEKKAIPKSVALGFFIHLLLDLPAIPWFWPLKLYPFGFPDDPLGDWIYAYTHNPLIITTELIGFLGLIYFAFAYKLIFNPKKIRKYLFVVTSTA